MGLGYKDNKGRKVGDVGDADINFSVGYLTRIVKSNKYRRIKEDFNLVEFIKYLMMLTFLEAFVVFVRTTPFIIAPYLYMYSIYRGDEVQYLYYLYFIASLISIILYVMFLKRKINREERIYYIILIVFYPLSISLILLGLFSTILNITNKDVKDVNLKLKLIKYFYDMLYKPNPQNNTNIFKGNVEGEDVVEEIEKYYTDLKDKLNMIIVIPIDENKEFSLTQNGYVTRFYNILESGKDGIFTTTPFMNVRVEDRDLLTNEMPLEDDTMCMYAKVIEVGYCSDVRYHKVEEYAKKMEKRDERVSRIRDNMDIDAYNKVKNRLGANRIKERWETRLRDTGKELKKLEEENKKIERLL